MSDLNQETQENKSGARIALPTEQMVRTKSASGGISFHCGDQVAKALDGLKLGHIKTLAERAFGIEVSKYDHLNPGQQRMTIGNVMRNMLRRKPELAENFNSVYGEVKAAADQEAEADKAAEAAAKAEKEAAKAAADAKKAADKEATAAKRDADKAAADAKKAAEKAERDAKREVEKAAAATKRQEEKDRKQAERAAAKAAEKAAKEAEAPAEEHAAE